MSHEAPKLYVHKPKKAQLKEFQQQKMTGTGSSTPSLGPTMPSGGGGGSAPLNPPRESFIRRYKFVWPLLLGVNFVVGAYLFTRTKKKDVPVKEQETFTAPVVEKALPSPLKEPVKLLEPIPENQQREVFKWMLEEKRKIKPKDAEEKKRIDEEKSMLKHFIRAKLAPSI